MSTPVVVSFALVACYVLLLSGSSASAKKNTPSPKRMPTSFPTIASAAKAYKLNTLVKAVSETPLSSAVNNGATAVTLFAPTDKVSDKQSITQISLFRTFHLVPCNDLI